MAAFAIVPASTFAATYAYVDTNANVSTVTANSAAEALTVSNLAPTSGVMLLTGNSLIMSGFVPVSAETYKYVNIYGNVATVTANSAEQALLVSDLAPTSGVMLVK